MAEEKDKMQEENLTMENPEGEQTQADEAAKTETMKEEETPQAEDV